LPVSGTDEQQQLVHDLREPGAWPPGEGEIGFVETHISRIFLGRDRVLKIKRPVHYSFVDYGTLEKRRRACHDEVRLNRLLADDIYLGVVPVFREPTGHRVGQPGDPGGPVEWGTWMRRLDDREMLDHILHRDHLPEDLADRLADRLIPFHRDRPPMGQDDPEATLERLLAVVTENLDEVESFAGKPLPAGELAIIHRAMREFIESHRGHLLARVTGGWVREGHGDLRCEHVIVPERGPVQVFDCVEFNIDLRMADVASDLGFLLMDLSRLGAPDAEIRRLLEHYRAAGIELPVDVLRFYWIHRALVRAKVHCLRLADLEGARWLAVARKATDYVHVAMRQAAEVRPALVAMTGLSGTGKSTVARSIARATGAVFLDTDIIRKSPDWLGGDLAKARGEDIYTPEWTRRTYDRMIGEGSEAVRRGSAAILDGTFLDRDLRDRAAAAARELGVPFFMVEVRCDEAIVLRRLQERECDPGRTSDAGIAIYRRQRDRLHADPPGMPEETIQVVVDTTPEGPVSIDPLLDAMRSAGTLHPGIRDDGDIV
jgi:uncharacterized protein